MLGLRTAPARIRVVAATVGLLCLLLVSVADLLHTCSQSHSCEFEPTGDVFLSYRYSGEPSLVESHGGETTRCAACTLLPNSKITTSELHLAARPALQHISSPAPSAGLVPLFSPTTPLGRAPPLLTA